MNINTLRPEQNGRHFADDIFKCILLKGEFYILIQISLKCVPWGLIGNESTFGSGNDLAHVRRQVITLTNDDKALRRQMASQSASELVGQCKITLCNTKHVAA